MASKRKVGNLLALAVLSYLRRQPMHPYELGRHLRENGDARSIKLTHGSLYAVVRQLTSAGFITEKETSREGQRPERTVYALTGAGAAELDSWLRELVEEPQHEYPAFGAALSLIGALPPDEAVALLRARSEHLVKVQDETRQLIEDSLARDVPGLFLLEEEYRLTQLGAESTFVDQLIHRITDPTTDWVRLWTDFHQQKAGPQT
jgi:DNA-binding PadR family transcriptional regulator